MRHELASLVVIGALLSPLAAPAQEAPRPVAYATYYECDQSREARADTVLRQRIAPILDRQVEAGSISAWGWLAHHTGGQWRRVLYFIAADLDRLLDAQRAIVQGVQQAQPGAFRELTAVCPAHDDYIWTSVASSTPAAELATQRPAASLSVYIACDASREARADSIVTQAFAPILNRHVEAGHLSSWSWLSHSIGGEWRRVAIYFGPDHKTILRARTLILTEVAEEQPEAFRDLNEICGSHQDYLWDTQISRP